MTNKSRLVSSRRDSRVMHKCVHINIVINANKAGELPTGPTVFNYECASCTVGCVDLLLFFPTIFVLEVEPVLNGDKGEYANCSIS